MIFKYTSSQFKELKENICKIFEDSINDPSLNQDTRRLTLLFLTLFSDENIIYLNNLDSIRLTFNNWDNSNNSLNNNTLSKQNTKLLDLSNQNILENLPLSLEVYLESLYLVIYADCYEASLITSKPNNKEFYAEIVNKLQFHTNNLSDASLKTLHNLWFEIPRNIFEIHLKQNLSDKTLENVKKLQENEDFVNAQIITSEKLAKDIEEIQESLKKQKHAFNFVGLSGGFNNLKEEKKKELFIQNCIHYLLMLIILVLIGIKSYWSINYLEDENFDNMVLIVATVSTVLLIFIILYFFRISLVNIKSIKSQILQIDLRLTLCQFIHNYENDIVNPY
jgi:hypothetical protein